jgi:LDH2 family malate/lactate/ureidoglycolate dehydrogenase
VRITQSQAKDLTARAFLNVGVRPSMAEDAAAMLTMTQMMGIATHGLARVSDYVDRLRAGGVNADAEPQITAPAPALRLVDGQNGLGAAVAYRATHSAMEAARTAGVGAAFCRNSSHLGALAPHLYIAAQAGFAAVITTNTAPMIAPAGGRQPVIGNAPLGFAIPNPGARLYCSILHYQWRRVQKCAKRPQQATQSQKRGRPMRMASRPLMRKPRCKV